MGSNPKQNAKKSKIVLGPFGPTAIAAATATTTTTTAAATPTPTPIANAAASAAFWNNTAPTSSVFTVNGGGWEVNTDTKKHIAYCWAEIPGYSKFGSYTGNGSTDGTYVHLGFKPAFIITKWTNGTGSWFIFDNKRNGYNETEPYVMSNVSNTEATDLGWDLLSNGFKIRNNYVNTNAANQDYVYLAFAESPFKNNRAR